MTEGLNPTSHRNQVPEAGCVSLGSLRVSDIFTQEGHAHDNCDGRIADSQLSVDKTLVQESDGFHNVITGPLLRGPASHCIVEKADGPEERVEVGRIIDHPVEPGRLGNVKVAAEVKRVHDLLERPEDCG